MKSYFAIYYPENPKEEPEATPLYSITLDDAIREAENELYDPFISAEIIECMRQGESVEQFNARQKEYAFIR